jgi:hypothetical protein
MLNEQLAKANSTFTSEKDNLDNAIKRKMDEIIKLQEVSVLASGLTSEKLDTTVHDLQNKEEQIRALQSTLQQSKAEYELSSASMKRSHEADKEQLDGIIEGLKTELNNTKTKAAQDYAIIQSEKDEISQRHQTEIQKLVQQSNNLQHEAEQKLQQQASNMEQQLQQQAAKMEDQLRQVSKQYEQTIAQMTIQMDKLLQGIQVLKAEHESIKLEHASLASIAQGNHKSIAPSFETMFKSITKAANKQSTLNDVSN